jgi:NADH:ubiquinone oxidoreductase subunit E
MIIIFGGAEQIDSNHGKLEAARHILEENSFDKSNLIPILRSVQEKYRYLPKEILVL